MGLRFFSIAIIGIAIFIIVGLLLPPSSREKIEQVLLSAEQKLVFNECATARKTLNQQKIPGKAAKVDFLIRDQRLEKDPILEDLKKCFVDSNKKNNAVRFEIDLFSSDYEQQTSNDLQVQISAFEIKSGNKVAEVGFRIDHVPFQEKSAK